MNSCALTPLGLEVRRHGREWSECSLPSRATFPQFIGAGSSLGTIRPLNYVSRLAGRYIVARLPITVLQSGTLYRCSIDDTPGRGCIASTRTHGRPVTHSRLGILRQRAEGSSRRLLAPGTLRIIGAAATTNPSDSSLPASPTVSFHTSRCRALTPLRLLVAAPAPSSRIYTPAAQTVSFPSYYSSRRTVR